MLDQETIKAVREELARGKMERALALLRAAAQRGSLPLREVQALEGRYSGLRQQFDRGFIDPQAFELGRTRLVHTVFNLLEEYRRPLPSLDPTPTYRPVWLLLFLPLLLGGLWYWRPAACATHRPLRGTLQTADGLPAVDHPLRLRAPQRTYELRSDHRGRFVLDQLFPTDHLTLEWEGAEGSATLPLSLDFCAGSDTIVLDPLVLAVPVSPGVGEEPGPAPPSPPVVRYTFGGHLYDEQNGRALVGFKVTVAGQALRTDEDGHFLFHLTALPPSQAVKIRFHGGAEYATRSKYYDYPGFPKTDITFALPKKQKHHE